MKKEIKNIEASVRAKLTNTAEETHRPFAEILKLIEAFLEKPIQALAQMKSFDGKWKAPGTWL